MEIIDELANRELLDILRDRGYGPILTILSDQSLYSKNGRLKIARFARLLKLKWPEAAETLVLLRHELESIVNETFN